MGGKAAAAWPKNLGQHVLTTYLLSRYEKNATYIYPRSSLEKKEHSLSIPSSLGSA